MEKIYTTWYLLSDLVMFFNIQVNWGNYKNKQDIWKKYTKQHWFFLEKLMLSFNNNNDVLWKSMLSVNNNISFLENRCYFLTDNIDFHKKNDVDFYIFYIFVIFYDTTSVFVQNQFWTVTRAMSKGLKKIGLELLKKALGFSWTSG